MPSDQDGMVEATSQPSKLLKKDSSIGFPIAGCDASGNFNNGNNSNKSMFLQDFDSMGRRDDSISVGIGSSSNNSSIISSNSSKRSDRPGLSGAEEGNTKESYTQSIGSRTKLVANLGKTQGSLFAVRVFGIIFKLCVVCCVLSTF